MLQKSEDYENILKHGTDHGDSIRLNLYVFLSYRIWDNLGNGKLNVEPNVNDTILSLLKTGVSENDIYLAIKNEINNLTDAQIDLDPYIKLIRIGGFETFVTVNYDNFLERAFAAEARAVNKSINFSIPIPASDPNQRRDPALPVIYNLMGNVNGMNFATTDEQALEYVYTILHSADNLLKDLFETVKQKSVLLLGCSFPDWFMRFFIRIISNQRLRDGVKAKYVACDNIINDPELFQFLQNTSTDIIPIAKETITGAAGPVYKDVLGFVDDLAKRYRETDGTIPMEVLYTETVFISYSWTDKNLAMQFKNELERNGVSVFFDDDELKGGDRYNQIIQNNIKECSIFLALISENAIADKTRFVYAQEWNTALVLNQFKDKPYVHPYIIDSTNPTDPRIPEPMRQLNIRQITSFAELPVVVRKFIDENKFTPKK